MNKHLITGKELNSEEMQHLLMLATNCKANPAKYQNVLKNKHILLSFDKPSLRTRLSFSVGVQQLGGHIIESTAQTRKQEQPADFIRVIQSYCDGLVMRTFDEDILHCMLPHTQIPIINGLSDNFHPCQILADLLTLQEKFGNLNGIKLAYIGDGNNILHSLLLMAPMLGVHINYCCPPQHQPQPEIIDQACTAYPAFIQFFTKPTDAVKQCSAVYTDVWTSMGFSHTDEQDFVGFQVNEALMSLANKDAVFMHCLPMERGKEVSHTLPDQLCSVIFQQSENRLHVQKALLIHLLEEKI